MDRFSTRLGVAELQATHEKPHTLALQANRIAGLRGLPHKHEVRQNSDGTIGFVVRDESGAEHLASWAEFAGYVADGLVMLRQEWPSLIADIWPAIKATLDTVHPSMPEPVKDEVRAVLIACLDEFDFDAQNTLHSWALERANAAVRRRQQAERDAAQPVYPDDGSKNDAGRMILEALRPLEPLAQLTQEERAERGAELFARHRANIQKLPWKLREVTRLRLKGKTFQETANSLRIPLQTAANRFKSAERKLAAMLSPADVELWRDLRADEPSPPDSQADTRHFIRDPREKFTPLPKVDFDKHVKGLPVEEQQRIRQAQDEHGRDHVVQLTQLERNMSETGDDLDYDAPAEAQNGGAVSDRTDKLQVTNLRGAKLSNAEIDQGTRPICSQVESLGQVTTRRRRGH